MYIRKDGYYKLAKQQGYRSRASFKLIQLNSSYHIIGKDDKVLDIGASPGGWMQVILNVVGKNGMVIGIDIQDINPFNVANAITVKGDIHDPLIRQKAITLIKDKFDTVVSDLSINITGNSSFDTIRNIEMAKSIVSYLPELLKNGGNFLIKLFYSNELKHFLKEAKKYFKESYTTKPLASRSSSSELYMVGKGFTGRTL
jgi:23S rRNA (uridine2552-2'-O)-methyltransferase